MGLYFAALSETVLEAIMRLLQVLVKLRRAVYGLRMHCQTVVKQRCSPVKIRFLTKKFLLFSGDYAMLSVLSWKNRGIRFK